MEACEEGHGKISAVLERRASLAASAVRGYTGTMSESRPEEVRKRALDLPAAERLALATELMDSVEGAEDREWASAWAAELDRRVRELESGAVQTIPWEQVKAEMLARLRSK
jgi:putative addiction module component (TIGR02574 family)